MRAEAAAAAQSELLEWLSHFRDCSPDGLATELLDGAHAAMLEAATFVGIGLGRGALMSIRTQVDVVLGYTYFSEHRREWELLVENDEGFMLRSDLRKYHEKNFPGFRKRVGVVESRVGTLKDVYRTLSAHVHAQSATTTPASRYPAELVSSIAFLDSVVELQREVVLRLSSYLVALYALEWHDLPATPVARTRAALSPSARQVLFPPG